MGAVQAGQLAANDAKDKRTDAKLEQQVGALAIFIHTFTYMEFESDRVCVESKSMRQYSPADLGHKCSIKLRVVAAVQAGKLERTDEKLEQQARPHMITRATVH